MPKNHFINTKICQMLNSNEAHEAVIFYFKGFEENIQVGNPQPFVRSYDSSNDPITGIIAFNELMFNVTAKNIFYGTVTYAMASDPAGASDRVAISSFLKLDGSVTVVVMDIAQFFAGATAENITGTTNGIFAQQVVLEQFSNISFDGYIFGLDKK